MYICNMKKISKNTIFIPPVRPTERKFILDSMIASFRIEGIFIPEAKVQAIYARVNEIPSVSFLSSTSISESR